MAEIALLAAGTAVKAIGQIASGESADDDARAQAEFTRQTSEFETAQLKQAAQGERAAASSTAREKRRESRLLQSRQMAVAAASGGGVENPTVLNILEDTEARGEFLALTEFGKGENRARGLIDQSKATLAGGEARERLLRRRGRAAKTAGYIGAAGTVLSAASTFSDYMPSGGSTGGSVPMPDRNPRFG